MTHTPQTRFVTFLVPESEDVHALTEAEFAEKKARQDFDHYGWEEWVWQFAASKEEAVAQHYVKMDEWHANPDKETY